MYYKVTPLLFCIVLAGCTEIRKPGAEETGKAETASASQHAPVIGQEATVYTTAHETDLRLAQTANPTFMGVGQPLENEVSVFVNPNKT
ncbi:MAG: hypothetical protein P8Z38_07060, partial [Robiginitalea sp.]